MFADFGASIAWIGDGQLVRSLFPLLQRAGYVQMALWGREKKDWMGSDLPWRRLKDGMRAEYWSNVSVLFVGVSDDAIGGVMQSLSPFLSPRTLRIHFSGSTPLDIFVNKGQKGVPCGVLYPLQSFSHRIESVKGVPFLIEGSDVGIEIRLKALVDVLEGHAYRMSTAQRCQWHLCAVMSANFSHHLWHLTEKYMQKHGLDFSLLLPLLTNTLRNVFTFSASRSQSGPAKRGDGHILSSHMDMLEGESPMMGKIYKLLSRSIQTIDKDWKKSSILGKENASKERS